MILEELLKEQPLESVFVRLVLVAQDVKQMIMIKAAQ